MKTIAMYLPQFHRVEENDKWWGTGYTDWTAVRMAEPLFEGHRQPRVPLYDDYYDLTDIEVIKKQAKLAKEYGIDGFCFYHYYFENGYKVLFKPINFFLEESSISLSFCICWANEPWVRSWAKLRKTNSWSEKFDNSLPYENNGILLKQNYGNKIEWEKHFYDLLPFFKDSRYIKKDGHPIMLINRPEQIPCLKQMANYWEILCKQNGLESIYIIGMNTERAIHGEDALLINGPARYLRGVSCKHINGLHIYDYDSVWNNALIMKKKDEGKTYFGAFTDFDDSPRNGYRSIIILGGTPDKFSDYLKQMVKKNQALGNEFQFINAWNEWGEGMYLEPDKDYEYNWLRGVKRAVLEGEPKDE